jgi:hypothetical protein
MDEYKYELEMSLAEFGNKDSMRRIADDLCEQPDSNLSQEQMGLVSKYLTSLAELGDVHAMRLIGTRYYIGKTGYPQDYGKAREWYEKAAEKDDSWALCNLGYIYAYGRGVEADPEKAYGYFSKSASMDNPNAMYKIGDCYFNGEITRQDYKAAYYWYNRAYHFATQPMFMPEVYPNILYRLGSCKLYGHGDEANPLEALELLQQAEIYLYGLEFAENPFAPETLGKVQRLIDEARSVLSKVIESEDE